MTRPPVTGKDEITREFRVAPGHIVGGFDGQTKNEGDQIVLTKGQAEHLMRLGAIEIDLPDFVSEDVLRREAIRKANFDEDEAAAKKAADDAAAKKTAEDAVKNAKETGNADDGGASADGAGKTASGAGAKRL